jgi:hypothetical protein
MYLVIEITKESVKRIEDTSALIQLMMDSPSLSVMLDLLRKQVVASKAKCTMEALK